MDLKPEGNHPEESGTPLDKLGRLAAAAEEEEPHCIFVAPLASQGQWYPPMAWTDFDCKSRGKYGVN